ncbi:MAG: alpha/beta hydrolase [bacterium]
MKNILSPATLLILATILSGCALVDVKISHSPLAKPVPPTTHAATSLLQTGDKHLSKAGKVDLLLEAIRETSQEKPGTELHSVNQLATTRLIEILASENFQNVPVTITPSSKQTIDPRSATRLIPSAAIRIKGLRERITEPGIGTPYVAWFAKGSPVLSGEPSASRTGMSLPATALVRFPKNGPELTFYRSLQTSQVRSGGRMQTLAADFSAPLAYLLSQGKNSSIDIQALIFSDSNFQRTGLLQIEKYDPGKIPVVFVHGLLCRPEAWTPAVNQLLADPQIRSRYQFWFYLYPTGLPVWWSAAKLRSELDRYRQTLDPMHNNPNLDRMVLVGHSMGGLISSLMVRKGGETLWKQFTDTPPETLKISAGAKSHLLKVVNFEPREDVRRVIFVATPHQGSELALNPFAGFFSSLVRLPNLSTAAERLVLVGSIHSNLRNLFIAPANSIRFLRAKSPLLLSILKLPRSKNVVLHSIIGDQGKGNTPHSSDGIVPYWSSHLSEAASEKIVPSGHGANENPEGIEEIRRILRLHLQEYPAE